MCYDKSAGQASKDAKSQSVRLRRENNAVADWFLQRMEGNIQTEVGPLRPGELLSMVRQGQIKPQTLLRKDDSAWFPASEVGGLFEAAVRREVQYFCPGCNKQVNKPPVSCSNCLRDLAHGEARQVLPERSVDLPGAQAPPPDPSEEESRSVQSWLKRKVGRKK